MRQIYSVEYVTNIKPFYQLLCNIESYVLLVDPVIFRWLWEYVYTPQYIRKALHMSPESYEKIWKKKLPPFGHPQSGIIR